MEIAKPQKCIMARNGLEFWIDADRADKMIPSLNEQGRKFFLFDGRSLNLADLVGIFLPEDVADLRRRKKGMWQCEEGNWHDRNETTCKCWQQKRNLEKKSKLDKEILESRGEDLQKKREALDDVRKDLAKKFIIKK